MLTTQILNTDPTVFVYSTVEFIERLNLTNRLCMVKPRQNRRVKTVAPSQPLDLLKKKLPTTGRDSSIDITDGGGAESVRKRPTAAGMQVRKIAALVAKGQLSDQKLQKLQQQLDQYIEKKLERFEDLVGTAPGVSETIEGLLGISEANDQLGLVSQDEIEELVATAEALIAEGRSLMADPQ